MANETTSSTTRTIRIIICDYDEMEDLFCYTITTAEVLGLRCNMVAQLRIRGHKGLYNALLGTGSISGIRTSCITGCGARIHPDDLEAAKRLAYGSQWA